MKSKLLVIAVSLFIFAYSINLYAAGQKNMNMGSAAGNQVEQQTQTANQGEESQIRVQTEQQIQAGTNSESGIKTQIQERVQERVREETGEGNQVQTQNQIKNKGEDNQIRNTEQQQIQTQKGQALAEQRRSQVANAVQEMLKIAERNGGIGQQIRVIAQNQNQNQEKIENGLQKIQARSGFIKFFIGPNYAEINNVSRILEESQRQIQELNQIRNQLVNQGDRQQLTEQIRVLEEAHLQIKNLLQRAQEGFSLFGWAFRLFIK